MNRRLVSALGRIVRDAVRAGLRARPGSTGPAARPRTSPGAQRPYPGDFEAMPHVEYSPVPGDRPDPGEVVWTWVPYEEDHARGKDRPVLLVGRDGPWLLGLQLTSRDHDGDARQEAAEGRFWVDVGPGAWDARRRPSEVRVNRVIRVDPDAVRRTSASLPRATFDRVVAGMRRHLR